MIGEIISHYRITDKLGAGGMGIVYKAQDLQLERFVALKFLPHDLALSETDRERFLREARSASALDHPNIGVIHGIDKTDDGRMFIVMAYYEGQTLSQKLGGGSLSLRQAMEWICQVASGLAAAHARNIIHRDIKPSNIIVTKDNSARIVDFGLARVVATPSATMTGGTTGTLPYMSPEQILGEAVDQRCDVWALAILLVQLVTGSHPFARENTTAMTFAILNQPPAAIEALPTLLQPIALHGLAKDVVHRYPDAKEMLTDLEAARAQIATSGTALDEPTLTQSAPSAALKDVISHASTPKWQAGSAAAQAAVAAGAAKSRRVAGYFFAALAAVALGAGSLLFPSVRQHAAAMLSGSGGEKHVAVLPFDNIGNDPANEAVAEGLMDSLTSKLSNLDAQQQSLWVVPSSVVRSRKISDPSAAGKDLGANLVVKGSIRRDAKNVQLTVNLIDAKDLRQVGSAVLDDATGDLAGLQDEAVARLARLMNINVTAESLRATGGRATPAAYELYLKALGLMQRYDKAGNLDQAVTALSEAVKTDPQFALGYSSLGEAYRLKNQVDPNPRWIEQSAAMLERSVQLDDRLPAAYVSLGRLHSSLAKHDLALQEFQKALAINPRDSEAIKGMAGAYERMGRVQDAEESYKRAIALRPDYWDGYNHLGTFYFQQKRYAEAIGQFQKVVQLTPDNAAAHSNLGAQYQNISDYAKAEEEFKKSVALAPSYAAYANLGSLYETQKRYAEAARMTEKALEINGNDFRVWANLALAYEWLNKREAAMTAIDKQMALLEPLSKTQPGDASLQSALAVLYAAKNDKSRALQNLENALTLAPADTDVLSDAAETYERLGERDKALQYCEKSLAKGYTVEQFSNKRSMQALLADPKFRVPRK
ncbi:MAG TPA: tetratricopeptide repeat protein [Candidatus Acidoferrum sp.]